MKLNVSSRNWNFKNFICIFRISIIWAFNVLIFIKNEAHFIFGTKKMSDVKIIKFHLNY